MKLSDYVIDTQGVLSPGEVMNNRKVYDIFNNEFVVLDYYDSLVTFKMLDTESKLFKFRKGFIRPRNKHHVVNVDYLLINDKMCRLLYE